MPRVKRGNKRRLKRKKILRRAKGYYLAKSKLYRIAQAAGRAIAAASPSAIGARASATSAALWIVRINAAAREHGMSYSRLMHGLKRVGVRARSEDPGRSRGARPRHVRRRSCARRGKPRRRPS